MKTLLQKNNFLLVLLAMVLCVFFSLYVKDLVFSPLHPSEQVFFFGLFSTYFVLPSWMLIIFSSLNVLLLWLIGVRLFKIKVAVISLFIYSLSPWQAYLSAAGSMYIFFLFSILLLIYGFFLIKENKKIVGTICIFVGATAFLYASVFAGLILAALLLCIYRVKLVDKGAFENILSPLITLAVPLLVLSLLHRSSTMNLFKNQLRVLSADTVATTANVFRGEDAQTEFAAFGKIIDNRYFLTGQYLTLSALNQFSPVNYFIPQSRVLGYSFSPLLYTALIIPFLYGLTKIKYKKLLPEAIFLFFILTIPSIVSEFAFEGAKLFLIFPFLLFITAFGIVEIFDKTNKVKNILKIIFICLLVFQIIFVFSDIALHEGMRL